jgi:hypothetical protein
MKNKDLEQERIDRENINDLETAEGCLMSARQAYQDNKLEEAMYWLSMASVHCKLIVARKC